MVVSLTFLLPALIANRLSSSADNADGICLNLNDVRWPRLQGQNETRRVPDYGDWDLVGPLEMSFLLPNVFALNFGIMNSISYTALVSHGKVERRNHKPP